MTRVIDKVECGVAGVAGVAAVNAGVAGFRVESPK